MVTLLTLRMHAGIIFTLSDAAVSGLLRVDNGVANEQQSSGSVHTLRTRS